ncbi:hypothetical protein QMZ92_35810 [Streptomyces sp. HNM0645]|uniref:hypothetical protein n=1 Tax=Streptomyces sp. HNM0645 TaxID=2782343 RepID=UPI0024B7172F|nr:hypothetical protein [Streptomyces sp. HNM0645]MDI9889518.1 hypothetical protein [Streptomyces sp. HNM0645]
MALASVRHAVGAAAVTCALSAVLLLGLLFALPSEAAIINHTLRQWWADLLVNQFNEVVGLSLAFNRVVFGVP